MNTSAEPPAILLSLREGTAPLHREAERLVPFFGEDFDRSRYIRWLQSMHHFYSRVERRLEATGVLERAPQWLYHSRLPLLAQDLQAMESAVPQQAPTPGTDEAAWGRLNTRAHAAGMLYVVEGSALGGQVLQKVLYRKLGVTPQCGAAFFAPHGPDPMPCWRAFIAWLQRQAERDPIASDAVQGAQWTFQNLIQLMDPCRV